MKTHKDLDVWQKSIQFLHISLGSAAELNTQLIISENLGFIKDVNNLFHTLDDIQKMLMGLIKYLKNK